MDNELPEEVNILHGVIQGNTIAVITREHWKSNNGIINNIRYADQTILVAKTKEDRTSLVDQVVTNSEERDLLLISKKTKFVTITKSVKQHSNLWIHRELVEKVSK